MVVFKGGKLGCNRVTQADPGPGNSVLPQWNRPLHGREDRKLGPASLVSTSSSSWQRDAAQRAGVVWPTCTVPTRLRGLLDQLREAHVCRPEPSHGSVGDGAGFGALCGGGGL